eukprot:5190349-Amphidinium_carterae.2
MQLGLQCSDVVKVRLPQPRLIVSADICPLDLPSQPNKRVVLAPAWCQLLLQFAPGVQEGWQEGINLTRAPSRRPRKVRQVETCQEQEGQGRVQGLFSTREESVQAHQEVG